MIEVEAPVVPAPTGGLLDALTPQDVSPIAALRGITYVATLGGHSRTVPTDGSLKVFDRIGVQTDGVKFSIYRGIEDTLFLRDELTGIVTEAYEGAEAWAVERSIQTLLLNVGVPTKDGVVETVDLTPTPGTPVTKRLLATGLLEQYAADNYAGQPLILTNRLGAALLDPEVGDSGALATKQGTPVVNAGGLGEAGPNGQVAPAGSAWAYVTGAIQLFKLEVKVTPADSLKQNRALALVEGTWLATVDHFVAAILVGN